MVYRPERCQEPTVARRTAEGLSKRDCPLLKRYFAREVFLLLPAPVVNSRQIETA